jgi:hypothetical protein
LSKPKGTASSIGYCAVTICYSNIYHECLAKLLRACSEYQGECKCCPVEITCNKWWDTLSNCTPNCSKITAEVFPYLVLQFMSFREKSREKSRNIVKDNGRIYQKEIVHAKH